MNRVLPRVRSLRGSMRLSLVVGCCVCGGCQSYTPKPLDDAAIDRALSIPADEVLVKRASSLEHPILEPIVLDDRDGLNPDEAAVLAVVLNPSLRAMRDARGVAAAQTIEAGLLPNPDLAASFGTPTGGDRAGAVNPYGFGVSWDVTSLISRQQRIDAAHAR